MSDLDQVTKEIGEIARNVDLNEQYTALARLKNKYPEIEEHELLKILSEMRNGDRTQKLSRAKNVIIEHFPHLWVATEACLSVCATLLLADLKNPFGLNLVGAPSSGKTTTLGFFYGLDGITYRSDHFTPKSFVSHAANVKKEDLAKIDLLPRIKNKVFIVSELAPLFGGRIDDVLDNTKNLLRVFDGEGWTGDSGSCGRRGYEEEILFAWLGATTPLEYRVWDVMGKLGNRWFFLAMPNKKIPVKELQDQIQGKTSYKEKATACKEIVRDFVQTLFEPGIASVVWDREADPKDVTEVLVKLAQVLARLRGLVRVSSGRDDELRHTSPIIEEPSRASMLLYNLARGHALVCGRTQLNKSDLPIVARVALSSMPEDRRIVFNALLTNSGTLTTQQVERVLKCSKPKALITMEALKALGVVDLTDEVYTTKPETTMLIEPDFVWLLADKFKEIYSLEIINDFDGVKK